MSYGLKPLVKTTGPDLLFAIWTDTRKADIADGKNDAALVDYISFCAETINRMLVAIRRNLSSGRWTTDATAVRRVLATTYVNSFLISLRLLISRGKSLSDEDLRRGFAGIDSFDFSAYHSSQYARMAEKIVETHF